VVTKRKPGRLRKLRITRVDRVDDPANEDARIALFKAAGGDAGTDVHTVPHTYEQGPDGTCELCGLAEGEDLHQGEDMTVKDLEALEKAAEVLVKAQHISPSQARARVLKSNPDVYAHVKPPPAADDDATPNTFKKAVADYIKKRADERGVAAAQYVMDDPVARDLYAFSCFEEATLPPADFVKKHLATTYHPQVVERVTKALDL
jgi:hypothetical protein